MSDERIDEAFIAFGENIRAYADVAGELRSEEAGFSMTVEQIEIETPVELDVCARLEGEGPLAIGCVPPLYRVSTTVQPVFHRLRMTLVPESELED